MHNVTAGADPTQEQLRANDRPLQLAFRPISEADLRALIVQINSLVKAAGCDFTFDCRSYLRVLIARIMVHMPHVEHFDAIH